MAIYVEKVTPGGYLKMPSNKGKLIIEPNKKGQYKLPSGDDCVDRTVAHLVSVGLLRLVENEKPMTPKEKAWGNS